MNTSQIINAALGNCAIDEKKTAPFAVLTLSNMIEKFRFETRNETENTNLKELNPFDGSFQIEIVPDETSNFIEIKSFAERAKEEGLV